MRSVTRLYGLALLFLIMILIFAQLIIYGVVKDELVVNTTTAVTATQEIMQEQIEDIQYGTNTSRRAGNPIDSNQEYIAEFKMNLDKIKPAKAEYSVNVYGVDYEKGLLDVGVVSSFKLLNGQEKTIECRKTSIVDIIVS